MSQENQILVLLRRLGSKGLSGVEAEDYLRVRDLPKRISVLRQRGFEINKELKLDAQGQRYMRYTLASAMPQMVA